MHTALFRLWIEVTVQVVAQCADEAYMTPPTFGIDINITYMDLNTLAIQVQQFITVTQENTQMYELFHSLFCSSPWTRESIVTHYLDWKYQLFFCLLENTYSTLIV